MTAEPQARPVMRGARVRLRPLAIDDAEAVHAIYGDAAAMRWWSHGPLATIEQTAAKLQENLGRSDWRVWAITLGEDDHAIGTVAAGAKREGKVFEIGYALAPSHWGQGIAREAVRLLIGHLFAVDGARRVCADTDPGNLASNALLRSLGFTCEGRLREEWETHIGVRDSFIWGLLARERRAAR